MSLLTLTHKIVYNPNNLPKVYHDYLALTRDIHEYNTRSHVNINIHPQQRYQVCSTVGSKDFRFKSHKLWNILPKEIKLIENISQFQCKV